MSEPVFTDPSQWHITMHAIERFRERFGGGNNVRAIRAALVSADSWEHLTGDLNQPGSRATLRTPDLPGVVLLVGVSRRGHHALITIFLDGRPKRAHQNRLPGMPSRWRDPSGRREKGMTSPEKLLERRYRVKEDVCGEL